MLGRFLMDPTFLGLRKLPVKKKSQVRKCIIAERKRK